MQLSCIIIMLMAILISFLTFVSTFLGGLLGLKHKDKLHLILGFTAVGLLVAIAVISHDFSDCLNTVSLMLAHKNTTAKAKKMLLIDAIAPVLGAASTLLFTLPEKALVIYLGFFAGFLLYIGASDIL